MIGLRGATRGEPDKGYDAKAAEGRVKREAQATKRRSHEGAADGVAPRPLTDVTAGLAGS